MIIKVTMVSPGFTVITALLVLLACTTTDAVMFGCFTTAQVSLLPQAGTFTDQSCKAQCANSKLPMYTLYCGTKCACSASIPDVAAEATSCDATATGTTCGATINLQYIHSDSTEVCELAPYPLTAATVNHGDQFQSERVNFSAGTMTLDLVGTAGARIETKDVMKYGLHEVKLQAAAGVGAVSSFYLINQLQVPPHLQDEIDLEFLDGGSLIEHPGAFWTNVWAAPQATNIRDSKMYSADLATTLGDPSFSTTSALHTYLLDWQPGYIRWYVQGMLVDHMDVAQGAIPSSPMYGVFSIWTQENTEDCKWFGGCLPPGTTAVFSTKFTDFRRIRCYNPTAPYFNTTLATQLLVAGSATTPTTAAPSPPLTTSPAPGSASPSPKLSPAPGSASPSPKLSPAPGSASPTPAASPAPSSASPSPASPALAPCLQVTGSTPCSSTPASAGTSQDVFANTTLAKSSNSSTTSSGIHRSVPALGPVAALAAAMAAALLLVA